MGFYTLAVVVFMVGMHLFRVGSTEYSSLFFYGWVILSVMLCRWVGLRKPVNPGGSTPCAGWPSLTFSCG